MKWIAIVAALALVACGQPAPPSPAEPAPAPGRSAAEIAERLAALPAPYSTGVYANGERLFLQCRSCHTVDASGADRVGPHLHGVFGRKAGSVEGFRGYSQALKTSGIVWDAATIDRWVADPRAVAPDNNMIFPGIRAADDRRDLVAYLAVEAQ